MPEALLLLALLQDPAPAADVHTRLRRVLDAETDRVGSNPAFDDWKRGLFRRDPSPPKPAPPPRPARQWGSFEGLGTLLQVLLYVVIGVVVAILIWTLISNRAVGSDEPGKPGKERPKEAEQEDALRKTPDAWLEDARAALARGDRRAAVRLALLAVLAMLHRARRIVYDRSLTNRECLKQYRGPDDHRTRFAGLVALFERAWYGQTDVAARECAEALEDAGRLGLEVADGARG